MFANALLSQNLSQCGSKVERFMWVDCVWEMLQRCFICCSCFQKYKAKPEQLNNAQDETGAQ